MHVHGLPEDILVLVLKSISLVSSTHKDAFKRNLKLLQVCRRWRFTALPLVYSYMYIKYDTHSTTSQANHVNTDTCVVRLDTNLDLVACAGCSCFVRKLDICVHFVEDPFWEIGKIVNVIEKLNQVWPWVSSLSFAMWHAQSAQEVDANAYAEEFEETSRKIARILPGITKLDLFGYKPSQFVGKLYSKLTDCYSPRLQVLKSSLPFEIHQKLQCIEHIQMPYHTTSSIQGLCMSLEHVKKLALPKVPYGFLLSDLAADNLTDIVVFPQLKVLEITYASSQLSHTVKPNSKVILSFPNLKSLRITNYSHSQLLQSSQFPDLINVLSIQGNAHNIGMLQNVQLPKAKRVVLCIDSDSGATNMTFQALQNIYSQFQAALQTELILATGLESMQPNSMKNLNITHLTFLESTHIDVVLGAIKNLPNLVSLNVSWLVASNIRSDVSVPNANGTGILIKPFDSKIRELTVDYVPDVLSQHLVTMVVKHLLLRLHSLIRLNARLLPEEPIARFIKLYTTAYPHLPEIELNLNKQTTTFTMNY